MNDNKHWMQLALQEAEKARKQGEVPVGAVIVQDNQLIARGFNHPISTHDPSAHAEIVALRNAAKILENYRLPNVSLYVTIEPCAMCAGALIHARIAHLIYGATDPKAGACGSVLSVLNHPALNHQMQVTTGVLASECRTIIQDFFREKRNSL